MNQRHDEQKRMIRMYQNLYQARTNIVKNEEGDLVADITVFCLSGGTISLSY
jgi:hypothetical protein